MLSFILVVVALAELILLGVVLVALSPVVSGVVMAWSLWVASLGLLVAAVVVLLSMTLMGVLVILVELVLVMALVLVLILTELVGWCC